MPDSPKPGSARAAPSFVTGGGGFEYEDSVAASVMAAMLAEQPSFGEAAGLIDQVDWQTGESGWEFDDLLLSGRSGHRIAVSCKYGKYVSSNGWSADGNERCWRQWTKQSVNPFRRHSDVLAVVSASLSDEIESVWDRLLKEAISTETPRFLAKLYADGAFSDLARTLFASLKCPAAMNADQAPEVEERVALLRHLRLFKRDFLKLDSKDGPRAVEWCRQALVSGDRLEATLLFNRLHGIAAEFRIRGGTMLLSDLNRSLCSQFNFKNWPNHEAGWARLDERSRQLANEVGDSIGDKLCLTQLDAAASLVHSALPGTISLIEGESGAGKSALAKRLITSHTHFLWLAADDLSTGTVDGTTATLGLPVSIASLIALDRSSSGLLVIDGAERLTAAGRRHAGYLASLAAGAARPWTVAITGQPGSGNRILTDIDRQQGNRLARSHVQLSLPKEPLIGQVLPVLAVRLVSSPSRSLLRALRNLKVLDLLARTTPAHSLTTFAELVQQIWDGFLGTDDRLARAGLLKTLGQLDARALVGGVRLSAIASADQQRVVDGLVNDGLLLADAMTAAEPIVTAQILQASLNYQKQSPGEVGRIFNLFWLWAAVRGCQQAGGFSNENVAVLTGARRSKIIRSFVNGAIPAMSVNWRDLRLRAARIYARQQRREVARAAQSLGRKRARDAEGSQQAPLPTNWEAYRFYGFDQTILTKATQLLKIVVRPSADNAAPSLIDFDSRICDLIEFAASHATKGDDDRRGHDGLYVFEQQGLLRVASLIAQHEDDGVAIRLWERLAPHLPERPRWCETFFADWFAASRSDAPQAERFHRRWSAMVQSAQQHPVWKAAEAWDASRRDSWSALLGLGRYSAKPIQAGDAPYLPAIAQAYGLWAAKALPHSYRLPDFCVFLQADGATSLRVVALPWVGEALRTSLTYQREDRSDLLTIASYCIATWYPYQEEVLANKHARASLVDIVQRLSGLNIREIDELKEDLEIALGGGGIST